MKPKASKRVSRLIKSTLSAAIIICMLASSTLPSSATENSYSDETSFSSSIETGNDKYNNENTEYEYGSESLPSVFSEEGESESSSEESSESSSPEEEQQPDFYTVTYNLGVLGIVKEEVKPSEKPTKIPEPEIEAGEFIGWFIQGSNESVNPEELKIDSDIVIYAKFDRPVSALLDNVNHNAYISGYGNGMFKPDAGITRAETVEIFYKLLLDKERESAEYPDVDLGLWYAKSIGTISKMGIVKGYENGKFEPNKKITRAEFTKIAVSFSSIDMASSNFKDVPSDEWFYPYISTASSRGWINGYKDGTFLPNKEITRAEAVSIVNRMLDRYPPADIKTKKDVKNFFDLLPAYWAYGQIEEASTNHKYTIDLAAKTEVWTDYEKDTTPVTSKWVYDGNNKYYVHSSTKKFVRGNHFIDGQAYYFDQDTALPYNGFRYVEKYKRYYIGGIVQDDLTKLNVVSGPYYIKVYKPSNYVVVFAKDGDKGYTIPVKAMIASCGNNTPVGSYSSPNKFRWLRMVGGSWAQWCTQIRGDYLFHSVPNAVKTNTSLYVNAYNNLGTTQSLGCIRLTCEDAKWVYDNCKTGTNIYISATEMFGPLKKPGSIKLPSWHTWDPTDPTAKYKCEQNGCKH